MFSSTSVQVISGLVRSSTCIFKAHQAVKIPTVAMTQLSSRFHQTDASSTTRATPGRGYSTQAVAVERVLDNESNSDLVEVKFTDERVIQYPKIWMRMHCQCPKCYSQSSTARALLMEDWQLTDNIESHEITPDGNLQVKWSSGHQGEFKPDFLLYNTFQDSERDKQRQRHSLPKKFWSSDHQLKEFTYSELIEDDRKLLEWLKELEVTGATLVKNSPRDPSAGPNLAEHVGLVKRTFFGDVSNVYYVDSPNNLAYSNSALDLHNDLAYNDELPGIIFLNMIIEHKAQGGESLISDGIYAAEIMREQHPEDFKMLATTDVFFTCAGVDKNSTEKNAYEYDRVNKGSIFNLYNDGTIKEIRLSNHSLNSFMDLPVEKVPAFVKAYKIYNSLIMEHSYSRKLKSGEMLALDNTRVQHGRTSILGNGGSRHLATSYMTLDEARCRRRVLQQKLNDPRN